jgi:hypothetical protein
MCYEIAFASDFYKPTLVKKVAPVVPRVPTFKESSGIVEVIYMIDGMGEVFEPAVIASTHPALNKSALNAIKKRRYQPFPQESSETVVSARKSIYFRERRSSYIHLPKLTKYQKRAKRMLGETPLKQKQIRRELDRALVSRPVYKVNSGGVIGIGMAVQQLLEFEFAEKFGSSENQINALERAAAFHDWALSDDALDKGVIETDDLDISGLDDTQKSIFTTVFTSLFILYVKEERFADSLYAYEKLKSFSADTSQLTQTASQIIALKSDARSIQSSITVNDSGFSFFSPLKENLLIRNVPTGLKSLKLRCETHFEHIDQLDAKFTKKLAGKWGQCMIEFLGEQGVTVDLIES